MSPNRSSSNLSIKDGSTNAKQYKLYAIAINRKTCEFTFRVLRFLDLKTRTNFYLSVFFLLNSTCWTSRHSKNFYDKMYVVLLFLTHICFKIHRCETSKHSPLIAFIYTVQLSSISYKFELEHFYIYKSQRFKFSPKKRNFFLSIHKAERTIIDCYRLHGRVYWLLVSCFYHRPITKVQIY
jgi:hypothetical protein